MMFGVTETDAALAERLLPHLFYERAEAQGYLDAHAHLFPSLTYRIVGIVSPDATIERTEPCTSS